MADDYRQIWVGEDKINLKGLDLAIEEIAQSHAERTDEEIQEALLERLSEKNYIADCARKEYAEALLREFRKFLGQSYEEAPGPSLRIEVLGPGCSQCNHLEQTVKQALSEMGLAASVEHVTDIKEIGKYGLVKTPALMINGRCVVSGTVPPVKKIKELLGKA
ncbi:MAG: thioredoxin family protein [Desulfomonile sp.]|nr:thioredoxin family protein [Desulfomonile sp.]